MKVSAIEQIKTMAVPGLVKFIPEITLYQATDETVRKWDKSTEILPPFWSFAWPGGQALARYMLDHPERIRGKSVLDFACGSGIVGIAAAKAGAAKVYAYDIDPLAQTATQLNAALNSVNIRNLHQFSWNKPAIGVDLILAGDICYDQVVATRILRWLYMCVGAGKQVLLGDPGRAFLPESGLREVANYEIPVRREVELSDIRATKVWELCLPENS